MEVGRLQELFAYNRWANARVLESASQLTPEQFTRDLGSSFPSVRDTLAHIYGSEWLWFERWKGARPAALPPASEFPALEALRARWGPLEEERSAFVAALTVEALARPVSYVNLKGEHLTYSLWRQLHHLVNHSTYHRGQITTLIRQLGGKPLSSDLIVYYGVGRQSRQGPAEAR